MEKNQQKPTSASLSTQEADISKGRPGQQLPIGNENKLDKSGENTVSGERHSESSLPERDEETLGTP